MVISSHYSSHNSSWKWRKSSHLLIQKQTQISYRFLSSTFWAEENYFKEITRKGQVAFYKTFFFRESLFISTTTHYFSLWYTQIFFIQKNGFQQKFHDFCCCKWSHYKLFLYECKNKNIRIGISKEKMSFIEL